MSQLKQLALVALTYATKERPTHTTQLIVNMEAMDHSMYNMETPQDQNAYTSAPVEHAFNPYTDNGGYAHERPHHYMLISALLLLLPVKISQSLQAIPVCRKVTVF